MRTAHERRFKPKPGQTKSPPVINKKARKPRSLTHKQRAAEAHAHYIIHHGSGPDATRFLQSNVRARHISPATTEALANMCEPSTSQPSIPPTTSSNMSQTQTPTTLVAPHIEPLPTPQPLTPTPNTGPTIPTWEEARVAVFSSSSEESIWDTTSTTEATTENSNNSEVIRNLPSTPPRATATPQPLSPTPNTRPNIPTWGSGID